MGGARGSLTGFLNEVPITGFTEFPAHAVPVTEKVIHLEALRAVARSGRLRLRAHERGTIHRDLKPANVKLRPDGLVKVLDFGLAKALEPRDGRVSDVMNSPTFIGGTEVGMILGTASYMSPEQARGRPVDRGADIWAFGVVLFEMLSGRRAFDGSSSTEIVAAVLKDEPPWDALPYPFPLASSTSSAVVSSPIPGSGCETSGRHG